MFLGTTQHVKCLSFLVASRENLEHRPLDRTLGHDIDINSRLISKRSRSPLLDVSLWTDKERQADRYQQQ